MLTSVTVLRIESTDLMEEEEEEEDFTYLADQPASCTKLDIESGVHQRICENNVIRKWQIIF